MKTHYLEYIRDSMVKAWDSPAMTNYKKNSYTYGQIAKNIAGYHILFEILGLIKGDKVALCGPNSAEWGIAFLGVTSYGAVAVPLLNDFLPDSIMSLTDHSEARALFISNELLSKVEISSMPLLELVVSLEDGNIVFSKQPELVEEFKNLERLFKQKYPDGFGPEHIDYAIDNLDELALINYTSGTTSAPKGVMLTNRNISSNIQFGQSEIPNGPGDTLVSMLPMAHMYGMAFEFLYQLAGGTQVFFLGKVPSPKVLLNALAEVKPYMLITVPLVVEKIFKSSVFPTVEKPVIKAILKVPGLASILYKQIRKKLLHAFGGNIRTLIIGGAAINQEVEDLMKLVKLPYTVGYGMTECAPLLSYEDASKFVKNSCGKPFIACLLG